MVMPNIDDGLDRRPTPRCARATCRVYYGDEAGDRRRLDRHPDRARDRVHRPVGLRQVDLPARAQPHERHHRQSARVEGAIELDGEDIYRSRHGRGAAARPRRHGVPEAQPVPQVDLRERRLRPAHPRPRRQQGRARRDRRDARCAAPACGTRSRTASPNRAPASPAASSSACASPAPSRSIPK